MLPALTIFSHQTTYMATLCGMPQDIVVSHRNLILHYLQWKFDTSEVSKKLHVAMYSDDYINY